MRHDAAGHYDALGLAPEASAASVRAAFRAAARRLHPDVPGTGDAAAFIRIKQAYDVLGDAGRRAAYDRAGPAAEPEHGATAGFTPEAAEVDLSETLSAAWLRPAGAGHALWGGAAVLAVGVLAVGIIHVAHRPPPPRTTLSAPPRPPASAPPVAPRRPEASAGPARSPFEGLASGYVLPAGEPAIVWRRGVGADRFVPEGRLDAFATVAIRGIEQDHGMVEIGTEGGGSGFVYATRLAPGDAAEAERARCIFEAGPPPANNEILDRHGGGEARVLIENRRDQPAVVKLRDSQGKAAASVFVAPRGAIRLDHLPPGAYRAEYAFGELWSHACHRFVAGMRAQRLPGDARLDLGEASYAIPSEAAIDLTDEAFNRD